MRLAALLVAVTLSACGTTTPEPSASASIQWDSTAASEARAVVERGVRAFESMDVEGVKSVIADRWATPSFETDMENKPVRMATYADGIKYAEDIFAAVKKMGASLKVDVKDMTCRGTSTLQYCVMDHDVIATMADGKPAVQPQRATIVLGKGQAGWKWLHWHSSAGPAASAPAAVK